MKQNLTCLLLFFIALFIFESGTAQVPDKRLTLTETELTGLKLVKVIKNQAGLRFNYGEAINAKLFQPVKPGKRQITVKEALELLKVTYGIRYEISGEYITLLPQTVVTPATSKKEPGRIAGKIIDEENSQPIPDVSIRIGGRGASSSIDGSFSITVPKGKYEAEISSVGYSAKQITDIVIKDNEVLELNIVLEREHNTLSGVVIRSSASKETVNALYTRQKNEAGISNGISREQISALPDKNVGETLKRISGVSTNDNRRVVIRGIAERYNLAMMDGAVLPSTDVQVRDFEFDIIPSNLIDNVVVSKTSTPDMSFGFGGGLVQVNTFAIPNSNFTTIGIGSKYVNGSTGKDFLGYGRGKNDYLGFDDGTRSHFPKDIMVFTNQNYNPLNPGTVPPPGVTAITPAMIAAQNKRIGDLERMGTRTYTTAPGQNYQFSLGRSYPIKDSRLGFVASLSYRNEQNMEDISHFARGNWEKNGNRTYDAETGGEKDPTFANQYNFNTTWGALLNFGYSSKNHKIISRNFYSRVFNNQFSRIVGWGNEIGYSDGIPAIREYDRPKFIDLLQNRINGEHTFGAFRFDWNIARNKLVNLEKDAVEAWLAPTKTLNGMEYNVIPSSITNPGGGTFNRAQYKYDEENKTAEAAVNYYFDIRGLKQLAKAGYQYLHRIGTYDWTLLPIGTVQPGGIYPFVPVQEWSQYLEFKDPLRDLFYYPAGFSNNGYKGQNTNQAVYAMLDNRVTKWLRLVWGVRAEYYKYERIRNGASDEATNQLIENGEKKQYVDPATGKVVRLSADAEHEEKTWRYLPSVNATFTPIKNVNIRAAYSQSVVRPALIENSSMVRYDPGIASYRRNEGVLSTVIDHYDLRLEWYPRPGEVVSAGYFYKYFDMPVEIYRNQPDATGRVYVVTQNSEWAKVHGWEFDLRKSFGFLNTNWKFLDNLFLNGNLTIQTSEVQASTYVGKSMGDDKYGNNYEYRTKQAQKEKRPLYGQVPVLYNMGLQYAGARLGANIAFNHMGYKTFATGITTHIVEYERPRDQLDAQLSYKFLKDKKLEMRLNMSNLMNNPYRFYINSSETYKLLDKWKDMSGSAITATEWSEIYEWKFGFSQKYEEGYYETSADGKTRVRVGDKDTFIRKVGTSFSLSVAYTF